MTKIIPPASREPQSSSWPPSNPQDIIQGLDEAFHGGVDPIYRRLGEEIGDLVGEKQRQYGDSAGKAGKILAILYPDGLVRHQYDDALLAVRVIDKLSRIAQRGADGRDLGGESPWKDIAGYGILGWRKDGGQ